MRKISNSEVNTWLHCRRKYWYEYILDLEPKITSGPLSKGTFIHAMLEQYYLAKMDGESEDTARAAIQPIVMEEISKPEADVLDVGKTRDLVMSYFDHYADDDERYEVVAVETKFSVPMIEGLFSLAGTIDTVFLDRETNEHIPVDHKSSYNFWTDDQAQVAGQFVKYHYALREKGFNNKSFMINQLRTRELKAGNDLFRRTWVRPTDARIRNVISQHLQVGSEIMAFRADPIKEAALPIYDKYGCAHCPFLTLCDSDTEGADTRYMIEQDFQVKKNYGYNVEPPE